MKILHNTEKWLSTELIEECFETGRKLYVDKVVTGNGFTTGFGFLKPAIGKVNVLIAPSKSIVIDKKKEHATGEFAAKLRCAFVYEGFPLREHLSKLDLVVIVSDSFNNNSSELKGNIDKLMVDEFHSVIVQSAFRPALKKMIYALEHEEGYEDTAITFVTASPLIDTRIDIEIKNDFMSDRILHTTKDLDNSIDRCVESIKSGKKTMIFTQDSNTLKKILKNAERNNIKLITGSSFQSTILTKGIYKLDENSNIVVCSSAAFEGHSDYSIDGHTYIFMNLKNSSNSFLGCNIYQALGRLRKGYEYAEICVLNTGVQGGNPFKVVGDLNNKIDRYINSERDSVEKKIAKNYEFPYKTGIVKQRELKNYTNIQAKKNVISIYKYQHGIDVHEESRKVDDSLNYYTEYFKTRRIELKQIDDTISSKGLSSRSSYDMKVLNIVTNIRDNNLHDSFMDYFFKSFSFETHENQVKTYQTNSNMILECAEQLEIELEPKWALFRDMITDENLEKELLGVYMKGRTRKPETEFNEHGELVNIDVNEKKFKDETFGYALHVAMGIVQGEFIYNYVAHRDYNRLVQVGIPLIDYIAKKLGCEVVEVDIKNCFVRILYALNGMELPNNFYGLDDEGRNARKKSVNSVINSFRYDENKPSSHTKQRANQRTRLIKTGLHEIVADYLLDKFFDAKHKGDVFNFLCYHEKMIMKIAMSKVKGNDSDMELFRRHDSFIAFKDISFKCLDNFEYEGQKGWFKEYIINYDKFAEQLVLF